MANIKYFHKLHTHIIPILTILLTQKLNTFKINPLQWRLSFFDGISLMNVSCESLQEVCQQFLQACKLSLHKPLRNSLTLES